MNIKIKVSVISILYCLMQQLKLFWASLEQLWGSANSNRSKSISVIKPFISHKKALFLFLDLGQLL